MLTKLRTSENLKISWRLRPFVSETNVDPQTANHSKFQNTVFNTILAINNKHPALNYSFGMVISANLMYFGYHKRGAL